MTAVDKVFRAEAEPAAADRPLPKSALDASGRSVFYRQLQQITELVREASELEQVMGEVSPALCKLFNADRLTLYGLDEDRKSIISKFKSGLASKREIKLPISAQSIAGYAALSHSLVNLADVYDKEALRQIHPDLKFLQEVDRRTGYQTREMLVAPILENGELFGVLQIINSLSGQKFDELVVEGVQHLCKALAVAFHFNSLDSLSRRRIYTSKYSGLVIDGILTAEELQKCVQDAREAREPVERLLINRFQVSAAQIGSSLSKFFGVRYQPFNPGSIRSEMMHSALKRDFVQEQGWLPLEDSPDGLVILCLDPEATRGARLVPQVFPRHGKFDYRVTTQLEFEQTVDLLFEIHAGSIDQLLADLGEPLVEEEAANESALESAASDNELVKFVNKVIVDAYHQRASDIHVEPLPGKAKTGIRFRIDGTLMPYIEVPAQFRQALVTRLKIMCDLDISEKRKPQDGKIKFKKFGPLDIELRVATIPSAGGVEDVVMRILAGGEPIPLENLGLSPNNRKRLDLVITKPYGLFYVCGPTGSGKTTTLHSILKILNTTEAKIWTAEDPVEITQRGLRQVQINRKAGIDFAMLMRAFLRADPDIIMVGESRDHETVSMGIEASLTGHLVFSTLHTNSAPESIVRLLDMGMDPFNFADALLGILAQRLAKRLCECKEGYFPDEDETQAFVDEYVEELRNTQAWQLDREGEAKKLMASWLLHSADGGRLRFYRAVGCDKCSQSGYKGRLGLHELLVADDQIKKLVQERARVADIFAAAVESGMRTLKMDGMEKVLLGLTDLRQVRAVCIK